MRITIVNTEKNERRYARVELNTFVSQLRDGTYRHDYVQNFHKEVCFAAEWMKQQGVLKAKCLHQLVLLSLENLRDLPTAEEYKRLAARQPCQNRWNSRIHRPDKGCCFQSWKTVC